MDWSSKTGRFSPLRVEQAALSTGYGKPNTTSNA